MVKLLAGEHTLCAFDFDGTLAPIVANPERAAMRSRTRNLLSHLALLYPCIVLSGRAREDLLEKLAGVPTVRVIGGHGADTGEADNSRHLLEEWQSVLEASLASVPGLRIENKGFSLAVHYRQSRNKEAARCCILAAAGSLRKARVFGGKKVVNMAPADAPNKGDALASERERLHCNCCLLYTSDAADE